MKYEFTIVFYQNTLQENVSMIKIIMLYINEFLSTLLNILFRFVFPNNYFKTSAKAFNFL